MPKVIIETDDGKQMEVGKVDNDLLKWIGEIVYLENRRRYELELIKTKEKFKVGINVRLQRQYCIGKASELLDKKGIIVAIKKKRIAVNFGGGNKEWRVPPMMLELV